MGPLEQRVEQVVRELHALAAQKDLERLYRTGLLVTDLMNDGAARALTDDGPYAQLKSHPELPIHPMELARALRVYEICQRIPAILTSETIKLSHVLGVLRLDEASQERLLQLAHERRLTVRKLREAIAQNSTVANTGRPPRGTIYRTLALLGCEGAWTGIETLTAADGPTANKFLAALQFIKGKVATAEESFRGAAAASAATMTRVLVVDPARQSASTARKQLKKAGYIVQIAHSYSEAVARMDARTNAAVISMALPDCSAIELARHLVAARPSLKCLFLADGSKPLSLPEPLPEDCLVYKSSGQTLLRMALANALRPALKSTQRTGQ